MPRKKKEQLPKEPPAGGSNVAGEDPGYTTGLWSNHPHYQCNSCHFNTLNRELIEEHVEEYHRIPAVLMARVPEAVRAEMKSEYPGTEAAPQEEQTKPEPEAAEEPKAKEGSEE